MTREEVNRIYKEMEQLREASYDAESKAEQRRLILEYDRMAKAIRPFIEFKRPYSEPTTP